MSGPVSIINRIIFKSPPTRIDPPFVLVYDLDTKEVGIVAKNAIQNPNEVTKFGTIQIIDHKAIIAEDDFNWRLEGVDYINVPAYESDTIPNATPGYFRTDMVVGGEGIYIYVIGTESETETPRPPVPEGTIFLGEIPVFGDVISEPVYSDDFVLKTNLSNRIYGTNNTGAQITYALDILPTANAIAIRTPDGQIKVITLPDSNPNAQANDVANRDYVKAYVDTKISTVYKYKGNVANYAALPSSGQSIGDVYNALDTDINWAWTGTIWDNLGGTMDISGKEDKSNKTDVVVGNETSTTKYLNILGAVTYFQQKLTDAILGAFWSVLPTVTSIADTDKIPLLIGSLNRMMTWASFKSLFKTVGGFSIFGTGDIEVSITTKRTAKWWAVGSGGGVGQQGALIDYILILTGSKIPPASVTYNNLLTSVARLVYRSPATAGTSCGVATGKDNVRPFSSKSGIDLILKFDTSDAAAVGTSRIAAGINGLNADIGNINPSNLVSTILVGNDTGDANLFLMHNDSSGTCTKIDLGPNFPHNTPFCFYELFIKTKPGTAVYNVTLNRYDNTSPSDIPAFTYSTILSLNVPDTQLSWFLSRNNGATAASVEVGFGYAENKYFY